MKLSQELKESQQKRWENPEIGEYRSTVPPRAEGVEGGGAVTGPWGFAYRRGHWAQAVERHCGV